MNASTGHPREHTRRGGMCLGVTKYLGEPHCYRFTNDLSGYCHQHRDQVEENTDG